MRDAVLATLLAALTCAGCADGTVVLVEDDDPPDTAEVEGNIRDVNPGVAGADIVVFVFTGLIDVPGEGKFENYRKLRSVAVASDADPMDFTVTQVESGDLTIVFLQDKVSEPDSTIDPGDLFATLDDPDGILEDVKQGETIRATDIDIDFNDFIDGDPAKGGRAEAETIRSVPDTGEDE